MNKRITIIGINYYPEDSAIGLYTTQKAEYLVDQGYEVTVITGFPYYPQWEIPKDYNSKKYLVKEQINGVTVLRSKQFVPKTPTFFKRIIHIVDFTFGNFINLFRVSKPEVVIAIIPFTTSALLGWFLKLRYKSKLWVHIQDFEFDAAIDSGLLSSNKRNIIKLFQWIEKKVLKTPNIISTISYGMMNKLKEKTNVSSYYLTNWIDVSSFKLEQPRHPYLKSSKFKILYSGNIGAKQDWEFFVQFLEILNRTTDKVEVVLVGEGAKKEELLTQIQAFSFVHHHNLVPYKELPSLLLSADLHILFQKHDVVDTVMPSKLLGMMASSKPSIVTGNLKSEVAQVFQKSKGGYYLETIDPQEVVNHVEEFIKLPELSKELGKNARSFVQANYSKDMVLGNFKQQLEEI